MLLLDVAERMFARAVSFSSDLSVDLPSLMHTSVSCGWQLHFASLLWRYFIVTTLLGSVITANSGTQKFRLKT